MCALSEEEEEGEEEGAGEGEVVVENAEEEEGGREDEAALAQLHILPVALRAGRGGIEGGLVGEEKEGEGASVDMIEFGKFERRVKKVWRKGGRKGGREGGKERREG